MLEKTIKNMIITIMVFFNAHIVVLEILTTPYIRAHIYIPLIPVIWKEKDYFRFRLGLIKIENKMFLSITEVISSLANYFLTP